PGSAPWPEIDEHRLVRASAVLKNLTVPPPAQMLKEGHVRWLNIGQHLPSAALRGRAHRELDQRPTELLSPVLLEYGQPVALPQLRPVDRVEAYRARRFVSHEAQHVKGVRIVVVFVAVGVAEDRLLSDEDRLADGEVDVELGSRGNEPAPRSGLLSGRRRLVANAGRRHGSRPRRMRWPSRPGSAHTRQRHSTTPAHGGRR